MEILRSYLDGEWKPPAAELCDVVSPATGEPIARFPADSLAEVGIAVGAAEAAADEWVRIGLAARLDLLEQCIERVGNHAADLAEVEQAEMGRPREIGRASVGGAVAAFRNSLACARSYEYAAEVSSGEGGVTRIIRHPVGVTAVIAPWNSASSIILSALGPILASGNTVVVKPSERAPMSTVRLVECFASLPSGVINLVLGGAATGARLSESPAVRLSHFTGSVPSGRAVAAAAGKQLHRSVLELGGKDPVIVDADVDVVATATEVAVGAFLNSGQLCTSMERIYVHERIADDFIAALARVAKSISTGTGPIPIGPLVDERQRSIVEGHVTDAIDRGARVMCGGETPSGPGYFYPPTVLTQVDRSMLVMREETFGPVAPVQVVKSFEEGIEESRASNYGLTATVYTGSERNAHAAQLIPAGVIYVNKWRGGGPELIFEPAKWSGMGAAGERAAFDAATRPCSVVFGPAV